MRHRVLSLIGGSLLFTACSPAHPVLYPNAHLQSVGKEIAEQDIEACRQLAETAGAEEGSGKAGRVATGTAVGAGVGAASGAVGGAIVRRSRQWFHDRGRERRGVGITHRPVLCVCRADRSRIRPTRTS